MWLPSYISDNSTQLGRRCVTDTVRLDAPSWRSGWWLVVHLRDHLVWWTLLLLLLLPLLLQLLELLKQVVVVVEQCVVCLGQPVVLHL